MNNQKTAMEMLERNGIECKYLSKYIIKLVDIKIEIRTYDNDYDVSYYPQSFFENIDRHKNRVPYFVEFYCKSIKDLEDNILFLTKVL